jgi:ATP-dependent DNA ligase
LIRFSDPGDFEQMVLIGPLEPARARLAKTFPVGPEWVYEPKWDGFRCLLFRHGDPVHLQSRSLKDLTRGFPEIVSAVQTVPLDSFVLDGELAIPSPNGFSFDLLVNRLRLGTKSERFRREVAETPAIYIVFDMLAGRENLLEEPFRKRRAALQQFFRTAKPPSPPIYLSASTNDLKTVEDWIAHIGQELDGIVAKRADAPYRPGDDRAAVKIKNYRTIDCVVGGFRDRSIGSTHDELLLGLYDGAGRLHYVGSVDITAAQKIAIGKLSPRKTTPFTGRQPGDYSHWNTEPSGPWEPVSPRLVIEVRYDHFSDGRFRHGCTFLRSRPDKAPGDCVLEEQVSPLLFEALLAGGPN